MKTIQTLFVLTLLLLSATTVSAQYGYGNNGYGNNGYGRNGGMRMNQMNQTREQAAPKEIPVEVTVSKIMEQLKPELNLDALQEIAVSNVLTESIKTQTALLKSKSSQEELTKEFEALSESTDRKMNAFLSEEQKAKYKALKEDNKNPKKSKKKK